MMRTPCRESSRVTQASAPAVQKGRQRRPQELRETDCLARGHPAGGWQRQDLNVGLGDPRVCSLPRTPAWTRCAGRPCSVPRGSPGPGRGWRNRGLAESGSAQSWRFPLGGEAVGQRAAQPATPAHGLVPWPGAAPPTLLASSWPLPSSPGQCVGPGAPQVWVQIPAGPLTGCATWG